MKPNISISFSFAVCALDTISKNHQVQYPTHLFLFKKHTVGPSCHGLTPSLPLHMVSRVLTFSLLTDIVLSKLDGFVLVLKTIWPHMPGLTSMSSVLSICLSILELKLGLELLCGDS